MKIQLKSILFAVICGFVLLFEVPSAFALTLDEIAQLLTGDGAAADEVSLSLAVDGDTTVIGAYSNDDNGSRSESAYLLALLADDDEDDDDDDDEDDDDDDDEDDDDDDDEDDDD